MLGSAEVWAQGTSGFEILRVQTFPRGTALAGAMVADSGHIESLFYNPAGLAGLAQRTATAGYTNYLMDIAAGHVAYAEPRGRQGTWGGMITYVNYGNFDRRDVNGVDLGSFRATDWVFGLSYANTLSKRYDLGVTGKFAYSKIENFVGTALALDIGGQMDLMPGKLRLGAGLYNLGWTTKAYVDTHDQLPTYFRMGVSGAPTGLPATLYASMTIFREIAGNYSLHNFSGSEFVNFLGDATYNFGAEFHPVETLSLRLGYDTQGLNQHVGTRADGFAGVSFGAGFDLTIVHADLGFASYGEMGLTTRVGLTAAF
jgi:hypothetical protein